MNKLIAITLMLGMSSAFAYYTDEPMTRDEFTEEMNRRDNEASHEKSINDHLNSFKNRAYQ